MAQMSNTGFNFGFATHSVTSVTKATGNQGGDKGGNKGKNKQSKQKQRNKRGRKQKQNQPQHTEEKDEFGFLESGGVAPIELYPNAVSTILDNQHLNAVNGTALHDLQCGTAKLLLQAFLEYPNLRRVFGIDASREYFHFAQQNVMALIKNGYNGRRFLLVENVPGVKMTIAEKAPKAQEDLKTFNKGDIVVAFHPLKGEVTKRENYRGTILAVRKDGIHYDIQMSANNSVIKNVHREAVFRPGTERTLEIARGSLFERSDSFRSDLIILPLNVPNDSLKSLLLTGCKRSPPGSRIMCYESLEKWEAFPEFTFRHIDANVYDNDRFQTTQSNSHRIYCYEHTISYFHASLPRDVGTMTKAGDIIRVRDEKAEAWFTAEVLSIDSHSVTVQRTEWVYSKPEQIKIDAQRIRIIDTRFKKGDLVTAYCPKHQESRDDDNMFKLYRAQITAMNLDGSYSIVYSDAETQTKVYDIWVFQPCRFKYREGQMMYTADKQLCTIQHCNPDGTYCIDIPNGSHEDAENYTEQNLIPLSDSDRASLTPVLPMIRGMDYNSAPMWRPSQCAHFVRICGFNEQICQSFVANAVNGIFLFDLDLNLLTQHLQISTDQSLLLLKYIRQLKKKIQFCSIEEESEIAKMNARILQQKMGIRQRESQLEGLHEKLHTFLESDSEGKKLAEYKEKLQCIELSNGNLSKKEIMSRMKRDKHWVSKWWKQTPAKIQKPTNAIKTEAMLRQQIHKLDESVLALRNQLALEEQTLDQILS